MKSFIEQARACDWRYIGLHPLVSLTCECGFVTGIMSRLMEDWNVPAGPQERAMAGLPSYLMDFKGMTPGDALNWLYTFHESRQKEEGFRFLYECGRAAPQNPDALKHVIPVAQEISAETIADSKRRRTRLITIAIAAAVALLAVACIVLLWFS